MAGWSEHRLRRASGVLPASRTTAFLANRGLPQAPASQCKLAQWRSCPKVSVIKYKMMLVWFSWLNLSLIKRNKQQLKKNNNSESNKATSECKVRPDASGPTVGELAGAQACAGTCTHSSTLLLHWRMTSVTVSLLHRSATTAEDLAAVLTAYRVSSRLLAQQKVALRQETGWMLPSQTGPGLDCGSWITCRGVLPTAQPRLGKTTTWLLHPLFTGRLWRVRWCRLLPPGIQVWS